MTEPEHRSAPEGPPRPILVELERAVAGGVVLGRDADGRVVLATGALPGEQVSVAPEEVAPTMVRGRVLEVHRPSPQRVEPPCVHVGDGCGGCDVQYASWEMQRDMRIEVVRDALRHTGSLPRHIADSIPIEQLEPSPPVDSRTTMRFAVRADGSLGLRRRRSHDPIAVPECLVAHPLLHPAIVQARFEGGGEVVLRCSTSTGEVLALPLPARRRGNPRPGSKPGRGPSPVHLPPGVRVVGAGIRGPEAGSWVTETVAGRELRISAESFFQSGPVQAEALGRAVRRALAAFDPGSDRLVDLYGGVGLFVVLLGSARAEVVELSRAASADARHNTSGLGAAVARCDVADWRPSPADAVIADPPRAGLGRTGVAAVVSTGAETAALVSCDPASMARDVSSLATHGYEPHRVEVLDMFPHTHHIETVTTLRKASRHDRGRGRVEAVT